MDTSTPSTTRTIRGPVLWIKNAEFGGAIILGVVLIVLTLIGVGVWSHFETKRQAESYALAWTTLAGEPDIEPLPQRKAVLLKRDGVYHWRAIVWRHGNAGKTPLIWTAKVRAAEPLRVENHSLAPYDQRAAHELELYDDVTVATTAP